MGKRIIIIQGSATSNDDHAYASRIVEALRQRYGEEVEVVRRIASAHRTPGHLQALLDNYAADGKQTVYVTIAGMSDALSGTVAARIVPVVAAPPDVEKYGREIKEFSSAKIPQGYVMFAADIPEVVSHVDVALSTWDLSVMPHLPDMRDEARRMKELTVTADARMQGAEYPTIHSLWRMGKVRELYDMGDGTLLVVASDRVSAFDKVMRQRIPWKGEALTDLTFSWFTDKTTKTLFQTILLSKLITELLELKKHCEWILRPL